MIWVLFPQCCVVIYFPPDATNMLSERPLLWYWSRVSHNNALLYPLGPNSSLDAHPLLWACVKEGGRPGGPRDSMWVTVASARPLHRSLLWKPYCTSALLRPESVFIHDQLSECTLYCNISAARIVLHRCHRNLSERRLRRAYRPRACLNHPPCALGEGKATILSILKQPSAMSHNGSGGEWKRFKDEVEPQRPGCPEEWR